MPRRAATSNTNNSAPKKTRRMKPLPLPGTNGDRHPQLDDLAAEIHEDTQEWQALGAEMTRKRDALAELMAKLGVKEYRSIDHDPPLKMVLRQGKAKVTVRKDKEKTAEDQGD